MLCFFICIFFYISKAVCKTLILVLSKEKKKFVHPPLLSLLPRARVTAAASDSLTCFYSAPHIFFIIDRHVGIYAW